MSVQSRIRKIEKKEYTEEEKQKYEKIFLEVWDNILLEKDLLMDMCELLTQEKIKALGNGITLFYYKTENGRIFVIEDDEIHGTLEIYEEKKWKQKKN